MFEIVLSLVLYWLSDLRVAYQSGTSPSPSSSPPSGSDHGQVVDISYGVFHLRLKALLFSESFPPQPSIP